MRHELTAVEREYAEWAATDPQLQALRDQIARTKAALDQCEFVMSEYCQEQLGAIERRHVAGAA